MASAQSPHGIKALTASEPSWLVPQSPHGIGPMRMSDQLPSCRAPHLFLVRTACRCSVALLLTALANLILHTRHVTHHPGSPQGHPHGEWSWAMQTCRHAAWTLGHSRVACRVSPQLPQGRSLLVGLKGSCLVLKELLQSPTPTQHHPLTAPHQQGSSLHLLSSSSYAAFRLHAHSSWRLLGTLAILLCSHMHAAGAGPAEGGANLLMGSLSKSIEIPSCSPRPASNGSPACACPPKWLTDHCTCIVLGAMSIWEHAQCPECRPGNRKF